jgi:hypothetical protein
MVSHTESGEIVDTCVPKCSIFLFGACEGMSQISNRFAQALLDCTKEQQLACTPRVAVEVDCPALQRPGNRGGRQPAEAVVDPGD